ncbi:MAG: beta-galactosidase [Steroidobacteraceae bacterium]|nr:beta-galactosidase [Steroidobacteraceae bacterium]
MRLRFLPALVFAALGAASNADRALAAELATRTYEIDISGPIPSYATGQIKAGGTNSHGKSIAVNSHFLSFDGRPALPVTGEFHYYRVPRAYWREQLLKMNAGGVNVVATYVHWIVHEEREGVFAWSGFRDLRAFVDLCAELELRVILRVGPFGHGEVRSGGFPDWLLGRALTVRSNDPEYLRYVGRYFGEIGKQVRSLMFADGGPIVAVQVENEYQHSASPWALTYPGQEYDWTVAPADESITRQGVGVALGANAHGETGVAHMRRLLELIEQAGMKAPIYTATGWGNATIIPNVTLPVSGGYAYPGWEPKGVPSPFYLFTDLHASPDYQPVSYDASAYPVLSAEIGPGIMGTYTRRPLVPAQSTDALINRFLGSGANIIGYYMFQGGSTPRGERVFYSDEAYGYPKISYDFQAPLGEFGDVRPSFHRLKLTHYLLAAFGDRIAPLPAVLPANAKALKPENVDDLRYAARGANGGGFLFLNNFQDHVPTRDLSVVLEVRTPGAKLRIPDEGSLTIPAGESMILPVNFDLGGITLASATAQPLTRLSDASGEHFVFFALEGVAPEFVFDGNHISTSRSHGCRAVRLAGRVRVRCAANRISSFDLAKAGAGPVHVLVLDRRSALNSWVLPLAGASRLLISSAVPLPSTNGITLMGTNSNSVDISIYPAVRGAPTAQTPARVKSLGDASEFSRYQVAQPAFRPVQESHWVAPNKLSIDVAKNPLPTGVSDLWLKLDYKADTTMVFQNGELVADHFYFGRSWNIGLKRFLKEGGAEFLVYFRPVEAGRAYSADLEAAGVTVPHGKRVIDVREVTLEPEYRFSLSFH